MKTIGGFYELLLPKKSFDYHQNALALSTGRACLRIILQNLKISKCYVPNYTCNVVLDQFNLERIPYELYNINENMEPINLPNITTNEYFYYINYFGIKSNIINKLYGIYGDRLIVDNTHAFFKKKQFDCWSYTSARKFFGVPDGAFLYGPKKIEIEAERFINFSIEHNIEKHKKNQEFAFKKFQEYERNMTSEVYRISLFSEKILSLVDVECVVAKRRENFKVINNLLGAQNTFQLSDISDNDVPFAYPFLPSVTPPQKPLCNRNIFIPTLWADPLERDITTIAERKLAEDLMPLPIDDRYVSSDMEFMAEQIIKVMNNA